MTSIPRTIRFNILVTDIGFLVYWFVTAFSLLPSGWLYKNHENPMMVAWNWSFAPIDILASLTGLSALALSKNNLAAAHNLLIASFTLTFCAGLMAISFWWIQGDFELAWWLPNLYLILWSSHAFYVLVHRKSA